MLPQKKNPDVAELVRGKTGRLIGDLTGLLATLKGLPLAYNRDLQEDKVPALRRRSTRAASRCRRCDGVIATLHFDTDAMAAAADQPDLAATDLAEYLVGTGMPFRDAHAAVGALVRRSLDEHVPLADLVAEDPRLAEAAPLLDAGRAVPPADHPGRRRPRAGPCAARRRRPPTEGAAGTWLAG